MNENCKTCRYGVDYGESVEFIYCEKGKRRKTVRKNNVCKDYKRRNQEGGIDENMGND